MRIFYVGTIVTALCSVVLYTFGIGYVFVCRPEILFFESSATQFSIVAAVVSSWIGSAVIGILLATEWIQFAWRANLKALRDDLVFFWLVLAGCNPITLPFVGLAFLLVLVAAGIFYLGLELFRLFLAIVWPV